MLENYPADSSSDRKYAAYFQKGKVYLLEFMHSDIGFFQSPNHESDVTSRNINEALRIMESNPDFCYTIENVYVLEAFLAKFPEKKEEVNLRLREGRLGLGATYTQPLIQNLTSELAARQLCIGLWWFRKQFPDCRINYATAPDNPAFMSQMPQLLKKSGITNYFMSRYKEGMYQWAAPDGSKVFVFTKRMYGSSHYADDILSVQGIEGLLNEWEPFYSARNISPCIPVTIGDDYTPPSEKTGDIENWNTYRKGKPLPGIVYGTFEKFMESVKSGNPVFENIAGERVNKWMYELWPTHYGQMCDQRKGASLARAAEIFSVFRAVKSGNWNHYPGSLKSVWKDLSFACHTFQLEETEATFRSKYRNSVNEAWLQLNKALSWIARKVNTDGGKTSLLVFNDQSWIRDDAVECSVRVDGQSQFHIKDHDGNIIKYQATYDGKVVFVASGVPSMGYKTYYIVPGRVNFTEPGPETGTEWSSAYENKYYRVVPKAGGLSSIYDKDASAELFNTEKFMIGEVIEQKFTGTGASEEPDMPQPEPEIIDRLSNKSEAVWKCIESGPVRVVFETNAVAMGHSSSIKLILKLYEDIKKIDLDVVDTYDGTLYYQQRIMFPVNTSLRSVSYEVPFGISTVGKDEFEPGQGWGEGAQHPREVQNFMYAALGNNIGVTIGTSAGVMDYIDSTNCPVSYPVLQPILLSTTLSCLKYPWTMSGTHCYHFSILSHKAGCENGRGYGVESQNPLIPVMPGGKDCDADLPESGSLCSVLPGNVVISMVKKAESNGKIAVRFYETEGTDSKLSFTFMSGLKGVEKTNLIEEIPESIPFTGKTFSLGIDSWGIETCSIDAGLENPPEECRLNGTPFGTVPCPGASVEGAFDGKTSTWFSNSEQNDGYVGIDLGKGNEKSVTRIRWYNMECPERMKGGRFQGSNEGRDHGYTDLYVVPSDFTPLKGWNEVNLSSDGAKYRYLRYRADNWCTIYELEFYGI